jgi:hypothetical protein
MVEDGFITTKREMGIGKGRDVRILRLLGEELLM